MPTKTEQIERQANVGTGTKVPTRIMSMPDSLGTRSGTKVPTGEAMDKVSNTEMVEIFGGSGMAPIQVAGLIINWDKLSDADRLHQFGSSDFREALRIMARTHPVKDDADQAADRTRQMLDVAMPFAAVNRGLFVNLEVLADLGLILQRYEEMRLALADNGIGLKST